MKRQLLTLLRAIPLFIGLVALPATGFAQTHGYGFMGAMWGNGGSGFRYGFGGAWAIVPHITAGVELGGVNSNGTGVIGSGNLGFHLRKHPTGIDPFFTAGITAAHMNGTGFYGNFGGGANYWFRPRIGFRAEFRAYPGGMDLSSFSELRFGVSFR